MTTDSIQVRVHKVWQDGTNVKLFDLRPLDSSPLANFSAGAHIDIVTPSATRQYSLCNDPKESHRYLVGIALDENSRGGSQWLHNELHLGDTVTISSPRNHFALTDNQTHSVFIAGGIGITPIVAMILALESKEQTWELHYTAKHQASAPLLELLAQTSAACKHGKIHYYFTQDTRAKRVDLTQVVKQAPATSHFYCCGPTRLIDTFAETTRSLPPEQVHFERFSADDVKFADGGFVIALSKSNMELNVPAGQSILEVLQTQKINVPCACREGICGSCEIRVLDGIPDHRDSVLTDAEKQSNTTIMACCSGALTDKLVLDI
jgi:vanillate O-demethylase ferredoxin subunit